MWPTSTPGLTPAAIARSRLLPNWLKPPSRTGLESLLRLAACDIVPFIALAKHDPGFPFEPGPISALNQLAKDRPADFERLRSKLKTDKGVRLPALEAAMKARVVAAATTQ